MFENIHADAMRVLREEKALRIVDVLRLLRMNEGLQALVIYRFGRWLSGVCKHRFGWAIATPLYPAYWMLSVYIRKAYGIDLDQSADIAAGFYINHFGGIDIRNCRIGSRCTIYQQVKLGPAEGADRGPVIGEGVFIGAHAQIRTDISVGDGASIGPGTVITQDIPPHCLVLGNPSRITQWDYNNCGFFVKQPLSCHAPPF
jgi:serine O-acetyltransferase